MSTKRQDYISWDEYFMGVAMLSGMRSKDPNTQVGACIVSDKHKILSMGYNGFPTGCSDDDFPWVREGDDNKYFYSTHSELNAILNYRGGSLEGAKLYVSLFPCNECAKAIIQSGIKEVIYDSNKYEDTPSVQASMRMFDAAGVGGGFPIDPQKDQPVGQQGGPHGAGDHNTVIGAVRDIGQRRWGRRLLQKAYVPICVCFASLIRNWYLFHAAFPL